MTAGLKGDAAAVIAAVAIRTTARTELVSAVAMADAAEGAGLDSVADINCPPFPN
jgi:hypothetical protein